MITVAISTRYLVAEMPMACDGEVVQNRRGRGLCFGDAAHQLVEAAVHLLGGRQRRLLGGDWTGVGHIGHTSEWGGGGGVAVVTGGNTPISGGGG